MINLNQSVGVSVGGLAKLKEEISTLDQLKTSRNPLNFLSIAVYQPNTIQPENKMLGPITSLEQPPQIRRYDGIFI